MYRAGWSRREIAVQARGHAMHGYGNWRQRARSQRSPLFARALFLQDEQGKTVDFCCLDLGYVTHAMRAGVCARLQSTLGEAFDAAALVLTCTHTHSGPGGCTHDVLYNVVTPGFVPAHLEAVIATTVEAILAARAHAAPTSLSLSRGDFDANVPVAWNRSLRAYNRNPDVRPRGDTEAHLALDRSMQVLGLRREGRLHAVVSLFGVHATCVGSSQNRYDGDNKGYAATQAEDALRRSGVEDAVAIFAQATAGDVSPHFHGPGQERIRRRIRGEAEYAYAEQNGRHQSRRAMSLTAAPGVETAISGGIDAILSYVDFTSIHADPRYAGGQAQAWTSQPCHGAAFFGGTPVDGRTASNAVVAAAGSAAQALKAWRLSAANPISPEQRESYRRLYAAQGAKAILLETGGKRILGRPLEQLVLPDFLDPNLKELKRLARLGAVRESDLVPTVLPLQIVTIGPLALVCCPGEFTTMAGARVVQAVRSVLGERAGEVLICTYCNDYMGYVTTREEYEEQAYEGGHTIFGQWTLAAFQTRFAQLAAEMLKPVDARRHDRRTQPRAAVAAELALRTDLPVPG
ncbi:MAG: ceramidase [Panacagrimonas sp.]|nr:neutral/alkaline non-lysosomal ceramidase N-terminal domain-containing protein [Panacagrimonas sp.]MCC2657121.1 ceramidase [Panacagrimonas sp.]